MDKKQQQELRRIVKEIPQEFINEKKIISLWKLYASDFNYGTFRKYLKTFREVNQRRIKNE